MTLPKIRPGQMLQGSGTGLDADLLDGRHGTEYVKKGDSLDLTAASAGSGAPPFQGTAVGWKLGLYGTLAIGVFNGTVATMMNGCWWSLFDQQPASDAGTLPDSHASVSLGSLGGYLPVQITVNRTPIPKFHAQTDRTYDPLTTSGWDAGQYDLINADGQKVYEIGWNQAEGFWVAIQGTKRLRLTAAGQLSLNGTQVSLATHTHAPADLGAATASHTHGSATSSVPGFMSAADKSKLDGIASGAQINQNAFSQVAVSGQTTVAAGSQSATLNMVGGTGITVTTNSATQSVMIAATGTATPGPHASAHATGGSDPITPASIGAATTSHGLHVPAVETANSARFLRNDNSWQTVTPANIGAATSSHSHTGLWSDDSARKIAQAEASGKISSITYNADGTPNVLTYGFKPDGTNAISATYAYSSGRVLTITWKEGTTTLRTDTMNYDTSGNLTSIS